jgi:PPE-repeat protein
MVLDFAAIPPEINSSLIYTGAGSGPLVSASAAYGNLAAELSTTASSWESILANLTTQQWTGVGSAAAVAAAAPYVGWLSTTAAALEHAGLQASSSAAAYEAAFAATIPPAVVAANRSLLSALVATNFLGINTPAIAATEAQYAEFWVQDATAMYTYAAAASTAAALQPLTPASPTTNPAGAAAAAVGSPAAAAASPAAGLGIIGDLTSGQAIFTNLWTELQAAGLGPLLTTLDGLGGTPIIFNGVQEIGVTTAWFVGNTIPTAVSLIHTVAAVPAAAGVDSVAPLSGGAIIGEGALVSSVSGGGGLGSAVSAGIGEAGAVGGLSVPASWSAATPATLASSTAPLTGSGWTAGVEEAAGAGNGGIIPGMPGMAGAAKGAGALSGPRYGFKPTVMPKPIGV